MSRPVVLFVDDYADAIEAAEILLPTLGYAVLTARDGGEALRQAQRHRPDVIVMDIFMPVMDGITASEALKAGDLADIPIIAYSAKPSPPVGAEHLFVAVCQKPCHPEALGQAIDAALAGRGQAVG